MLEDRSVVVADVRVPFWSLVRLLLKVAIAAIPAALLLAALCVNKQFDLQSLFTAIGREISHQGGWYERRRDFLPLSLILFSLFTLNAGERRRHLRLLT